MGELKFNQDLFVFEEDEDPLQSSLHLEDLQNLSSFEVSNEPSSTLSCCSSDAIPTMNPTDTNEERDHPELSKLAESEFIPNGALMEQEGSTPVVEDEEANEDTSLTPAKLSPQVSSDVSCSIQENANPESNSVDDMMTLDPDEVFPPLPSFEDDEFFSCSGSDTLTNNENESPPFHYSSLQEDVEHVIKRIHSIKILESLEKENKERQENQELQVHQEHRVQQVQLMPENGIQKLTRSSSRSWRLGRMSSHTVRSKKNYVDLDSNTDKQNTHAHTVSKKSRNAPKQKKVLRNKTNDAASCVSSSVSLASRLSKALTPKWIKKRKEKNRQEKKAVARARALMFVRNNKGAQENDVSMQDDDSIMTSVPIQNEHSVGDIIENIERLDSISLYDPYSCNRQGSFHRRMSLCNDSLSGVSKTTSSSVVSNHSSCIGCGKTDIVSQHYPQCLNHIVCMHSAPIIQERKEKIRSDSKVALLEKRHSCQPTKKDGKRVMINALSQSKCISPTSKCSTDGDAPHRPTSISWKNRDSVEMKSEDDNQDDVSYASEASSIGSKSVSAAVNPSPTNKEAILALTQNLSTSPKLHRTFSLPSPLPHSEKSYASHLLCCHNSSSTASISSNSMSSTASHKTSNIRSQSNSPTTSSARSLGMDHSDCTSISSAGYSVSSSTYTALSNYISYKDPCAKPSKIIKRSNLDVSGHGDGDIWVERIFVSKRTGKRKIFFVSVATGRKVRGEPPTGASKVIYQDDLQHLRRLEAEEQLVGECMTPVQLANGLSAC
mmetsp:Transcript_446/g.750  ORF Transcript_446/g.750 Transcript_446/m.750 type:complete len:777 (+) Transcript_446:216-2546(+)